MALALVADGRLNLLEKAVVGAIKLGTLATGWVSVIALLLEGVVFVVVLTFKYIIFF